MQTFKIYDRYDGTKVLFEREGNSLREVVIAAVESSADLMCADLMYADLRSADLASANLACADLRYANLTSADLMYANLTSANLRYANLTYANLRYANLTYANLTYADLTYANLTSADLASANLRYANLMYANLTYANLASANLTYADLMSANLMYADLMYADLRSADLTYADLRSADLMSANLTHIKQDLWDVLLRAPGEVEGLIAALKGGRVNGSVYEGECACLVGTIANIAHCNYLNLDFIKPNSSRPAERWFIAICEGDTPDKSVVAKLTVEWAEEFEQLLSRAVTIRNSAVSQ